MARPTKLSAGVQQAICEGLATGMTRTGVAALARVTYKTFDNWYKRGAEVSDALEADSKAHTTAEDRRYYEFFLAVNEAEAQAEYDFTAIIYNEAQRDAAHAWRWLERRRKRDYNTAPHEIQLSGPAGGPIETIDAGLTDDERMARLVALFDAARARRDRQSPPDN